MEGCDRKKAVFQIKIPRKKINKNKKSKSVVKQWFFKTLDKSNCMKKYFRANSALILVRTIRDNIAIHLLNF